MSEGETPPLTRVQLLEAQGLTPQDLAALQQGLAPQRTRELYKSLYEDALRERRFGRYWKTGGSLVCVALMVFGVLLNGQPGNWEEHRRFISENALVVMMLTIVMIAMPLVLWFRTGSMVGSYESLATTGRCSVVRGTPRIGGSVVARGRYVGVVRITWGSVGNVPFRINGQWALGLDPNAVYDMFYDTGTSTYFFDLVG